MNRRDFLTAILGAPLAATVLPSLLQARSLQPVEPLDDPVWDETYASVHREAWRRFRLEMQAHRWPCPDTGEKLEYIGQMFSDRLLCTHQFNVSLYEGNPLHVEAAMKSLTQRVRWQGMDRFALMDRYLPGTYYSTSYGILRMVVAYDVQRDYLLTRFDVLGGVSPTGERLARINRQHELKERIRRRLRKQGVIHPLLN